MGSPRPHVAEDPRREREGDASACVRKHQAFALPTVSRNEVFQRVWQMMWQATSSVSYREDHVAEDERAQVPQHRGVRPDT